MKRYIWIWSLLSCGGLFFLTGCTFHQSVIPAVGVGDLTFEPLKDSEYRIVDDVKGTATGGRILFWSYGDTGVFSDVRSGSFAPNANPTRRRICPLRVLFFGVWGLLFPVLEHGSFYDDLLSRDPAISTAMYDAIESTPNADSMILPRIKKRTFQAFLWSDYEVEVEGKAIEITKDAR